MKTNRQRTNETKNPNKAKLNQRSMKYWWVCYVLTSYSWPWHLSRTVANIHTDTPLEKTDFPFASRCRLQIVSWLGVGPHIHFPLLVLGPHLSWTCADLAHAATGSVSSYVPQHLVSGSYCFFFGIFYHLWLLQPFRLFHLEGRGSMKTSHLGLRAPKSLTLWTLYII